MWMWKCVSRKQPPPWWEGCAAECPCCKSEQAAAWEPMPWHNKFFHFFHESCLRCQLQLLSSCRAHCICLLFVSFLALIFDIRLLTWRKVICALAVYSSNVGFALDIELYLQVMRISSSFQQLLSNFFVAWSIRLYCSSFQDWGRWNKNIPELEVSSSPLIY